ncbi:hypothetical protein HDU96_009590 [Phlyctochytrium bullatum]|nr:hypothetical protein HDU96_009590 [Phlyctochytrium bullatum]
MATGYVDYYKVLQVDRSADGESIRRAYRKLSLKVAFDSFFWIAEAYDVLSNGKRRAIYDQYGPDGLRNGVPQRDGTGPSGSGLIL